MEIPVTIRGYTTINRVDISRQKTATGQEWTAKFEFRVSSRELMGVVRIGDARVSNARAVGVGNSPMEMIVIPQRKEGDETTAIIIGTCLGLKFVFESVRIRQEGVVFKSENILERFGAAFRGVQCVQPHSIPRL